VAGALAQVVVIVLDLLVADVAEQLLALTAGHFILLALLWIDCVAFRALNTPLDVDVGVSFVAHVLLYQLLSN